MTRSFARLLVVAVSVTLVCAAAAPALEIGDEGPAWNKVIGVDDQPHSLSDHEGAKAVVVVFTCNHCPVAVAYEDRLTQFTADYKEKGVAVVAINVNNLEADKLPAMKVRAEEKGFNFPYLHDPTQQVARDYGATVTPHVFVLDGERKVVYMGAIDDNNNPKKAEKQYLRDAVDAVLAGETPETQVTRQRGCGIKYEKKQQ